MTATLDRPKTFTCHRCRVTKPIRDEGLVVGYAKDDKDNYLCYECCGEIDRDYMLEQGKITLYLTCEPTWKERSLEGRKQAGIVSNWPGTLKFTCRTRVGDHNIARYRYDCWFTGPDGYIWHGIQYGDNTQICHCKRTKERKQSSTSGQFPSICHLGLQRRARLGLGLTQTIDKASMLLQQFLLGWELCHGIGQETEKLTQLILMPLTEQEYTKMDTSFENMDCMMIDELEKYKYTLFDAYKYSVLKLRAMEMRGTGNIAAAMQLEEQLEKIYNRIPKEYRW